MSAPLLEVRDLVVDHAGARVLDGVGFAVPRGRALALLGRNGAGKSTTLRAVMGLVPRRRGTVRFAGRDLERARPFEIARLGVGYVPEDRRIFRRLTVLENLEVGRIPARDRDNPWTPARLFDLFPNLRDRRHHPCGRLSGGEQQMLAIARALRGNPELLLLDEPSEGLAPAVVRQLLAALRAARAHGLTLVLSEQNWRFARLLAEEVCILERGRVVFLDRTAELDARPDLRRRWLAV